MTSVIVGAFLTEMTPLGDTRRTPYLQAKPKNYKGAKLKGLTLRQIVLPKGKERSQLKDQYLHRL